MEIVFHALTRKVLGLETKVEVMKKNIKTNILIEKPKEKISETVKIKQKEVQEEVKNLSCSFSNIDIQDTCSTPAKEDKERVKEDKPKNELLKFKDCNYSCKKETFLNKHMLKKN